jgi:hypothetical protein
MKRQQLSRLGKHHTSIAWSLSFRLWSFSWHAFLKERLLLQHVIKHVIEYTGDYIRLK